MSLEQLTERGLYSIQLPSNTNSIAIVESFIDDLVATLSIGDEVYANLMTCLNEAVTNAIFHGNRQNPDKTVYFNLELVNNKKLIFTIADEGSGFNFSNVPDPTSPENLENLSGRGVFIMKQLADQCIFNTLGNEVELHFKI